MGGGEEMGEGGEEDMGWQSLMALAEVKKGAAGGQPKGFFFFFFKFEFLIFLINL